MPLVLEFKMTFIPRTAEEILNDFVNYLTINTQLTDFNVGSVIRTMLEVVALEDATQYSQMINVLNAFYFETATGDALEDRAAQYGLSRKEPTPSSGTVFFLDTSLEKTFLIQNLTAGVSTSIPVNDAAVFLAPPFTVRLGEGTGGQEDVIIDAVNTTTNILTAPAAVVFDHASATSTIDTIDNRSHLVCFVSGLPDRTIPSGVTLQSTATNVNISVSAYTTAPAIFPNGNFASNLAAVLTNNFGTGSTIPPKMLNEVSGSPPFFGATVVNTSAISGGADLESDDQFRARIREHIGGLSAGTISALVSAILNSGTAESERITKVNIFEDFANRVAFAYVNTGSDSFIGTQNLAITDTLSAPIVIGNPIFSINNITDFPEATSGSPQWGIIDPSAAIPEVFQYEEKTATGVVSVFSLGVGIAANTIIAIPEVVTENTEFNQKYYTLTNFPLTSDATLLLHLVNYDGGPPLTVGSTIALLIQNDDYIINEAIGQIEFLEGKIPLEGRAILATYSSYTGIIKAAQTAVDGSLEDPINFPGVRSAGVKVRVLPALKEIIDLVIDITYDSDLTNIETLQFLAEQAARSYVVGLPIGGDIILAEIIERLMGVVGVTNVHVVSPSSDVSILHDHYAAIGIVTVS